jgi:hypothetical protein
MLYRYCSNNGAQWDERRDHIEQTASVRTCFESPQVPIYMSTRRMHYMYHTGRSRRVPKQACWESRTEAFNDVRDHWVIFCSRLYYISDIFEYVYFINHAENKPSKHIKHPVRPPSKYPVRDRTLEGPRTGTRTVATTPPARDGFIFCLFASLSTAKYSTSTY